MTTTTATTTIDAIGGIIADLPLTEDDNLAIGDANATLADSDAVWRTLHILRERLKALDARGKLLANASQKYQNQADHKSIIGDPEASADYTAERTRRESQLAAVKADADAVAEAIAKIEDFQAEAERRWRQAEHDAREAEAVAAHIAQQQADNAAIADEARRQPKGNIPASAVRYHKRNGTLEIPDIAECFATEHLTANHRMTATQADALAAKLAPKDIHPFYAVPLADIMGLLPMRPRQALMLINLSVLWAKDEARWMLAAHNPKVKAKRKHQKLITATAKQIPTCRKHLRRYDAAALARLCYHPEDWANLNEAHYRRARRVAYALAEAHHIAIVSDTEGAWQIARPHRPPWIDEPKPTTPTFYFPSTRIALEATLPNASEA